jgi:hypothetical protein
VFFDAPFGPVGDLAEGPLAHYLRRLIEHRNRYLREARGTSDLRLDDLRRGRPSPATSPAATGDGRRGSCRPSGRSGST